MDHEREVCSWFMMKEDVIISVESFFMQQESKENIQALEDCILYSISYEELQYAYENFMEFNYIGRILTTNYYMLAEQRLYSLRMQTTQERYQYLMDHFPQFILRVPSKDIASYIGRAGETLSRNKKRKNKLLTIAVLLFAGARAIFHRIF
jgi:CRP-like cAMP-binding protein